MISKINDEIMASMTGVNLKFGNQKGGQQKTGGVPTAANTTNKGLPGNTSIMNSNENSSNSGPNTTKLES